MKLPNYTVGMSQQNLPLWQAQYQLVQQNFEEILLNASALQAAKQLILRVKNG
jgi:hypothetical protein